jgi:hypothetical protein
MWTTGNHPVAAGHSAEVAPARSQAGLEELLGRAAAGVATVGIVMAHTGEEFENPVSGERSVVRLGVDDTDGEAVVADLYWMSALGTRLDATP